MYYYYGGQNDRLILLCIVFNLEKNNCNLLKITNAANGLI